MAERRDAIDAAFPATVQSLSPTMVLEDGATTPVAAPWHNGLGSYTPAVNDRVVVIPYRGALYILGTEVAG